MREALIDGIVRLTGGNILKVVPISFLPPYGRERQEFGRFLQAIPEGGLGFHATCTRHFDSISIVGLNPNYSPQFSARTVYYEVLDPKTDPLLLEAPGVEGNIATYHRIKNGLNKIILKYGDSNAGKFSVIDDSDEPYRAAVVVFTNAWGLATVTQENEKKFYTNNPYYDSKRDYYKPVITARLSERMFYLPKGQASHMDPGSIDDLPVAEAYLVPPENIVEIFIAEELPISGVVYKTPDYITTLTDKIMAALIKRYTDE